MAKLRGEGKPEHKGLITPAQQKSKLKNVLFYGDSLTWGMAHNYTGRYAKTWPRLLTAKLKRYGLEPVESALCSRTTCWDDENNDEWMTGAEPHYFNGLKHLYCELINSTPSWLVILLGTNDLRVAIRREAKKRTRIDACEIAKNCAKVALKARDAANSCSFLDERMKILLIAPPAVVLNELSKELGYDETSVSISADFARAYKEISETHGFLYASCEIDMSKSTDGIHITQDANARIAGTVWKAMKKELGPPPKKLAKYRSNRIPGNEISKVKTIKKRNKKRRKLKREVNTVRNKRLKIGAERSAEIDSKSRIQDSVERSRRLQLSNSDLRKQYENSSAVKNEGEHLMRSSMDGIRFEKSDQRAMVEKDVVKFFNLLYNTDSKSFKRFINAVNRLSNQNPSNSMERLKDLSKFFCDDDTLSFMYESLLGRRIAHD